MKNTRKHVAAALAVALLAIAGISGSVAAFGPGDGHHAGDPSASARPTWAPRSFDPGKTPRSKSSTTPRAVPSITCTTTSNPTAGASVAPKDGATTRDRWTLFVRSWRSHISPESLQQYCSVEPLRLDLDRQIGSRIGALQRLETTVGAAPGLSSSDVAAIDGELNSLIAGLTALRTKVDSETTLAALQADVATLRTEGSVFRDVKYWAGLIVGAEKVIAAGPGLVALENTLATQIAAAPPGPETEEAKALLAAMTKSVTDAENLAAPLPATLLALTPAQLESGAADVALWQANRSLFRATWDLQWARAAAAHATRELQKANATPKPSSTASPS